MCEIDYSVTTAGSFQLGVGTVAKAGQAINHPTTAPAFDMAEALLLIEGAPKLGYGGEKLSNTAAAVQDAVIRGGFFVQNSGTVDATGAQPNQGFDLTYHQVPC